MLNPTLNNGDKYWLVVGPATDTSAAGWNYTWFGPAGSALNTLANVTPHSGIPTLAGPWAYDGNPLMEAFAVDGMPLSSTAPVPEPAPLAFMGAVLLGILVMSRRRVTP